MTKIVKMRDSTLRGKSFRMDSDFEIMEVFRSIRVHTLPVYRKSINWYIGKSRTHVAADYTRSEFLSRIGVKVDSQFALATICNDLVLMVELCILGDDGLIYEKNECSSSNLRDLPTPEEIASFCKEVRIRKPITDYHDKWIGFDGPHLRTCDFEELEGFDVGFDS